MIITSTSYLVPQSIQVVSSLGATVIGNVAGPSEGLVEFDIGTSVLKVVLDAVSHPQLSINQGSVRTTS